MGHKFGTRYKVTRGVFLHPITQGCAPVFGGFWLKNPGNGTPFLTKNSGIGVEHLLEILELPRFGKINNFLLLFRDAITGQIPHPYSEIGSQSPAKILGLNLKRIS